MKKIFRVLAMGLVAGLSLAVIANAGNLQKTQVPADTKWLIHFDSEAFQSSQLGKELETRVKMSPVAGRLESLELLLGVDPMTALNSVTVMGNSLVPGQGAMLISTKVKNDTIQTMLTLNKTCKESDYNGTTIYSLSGHCGRRFVSFLDEGQVVVGSDQKRVTWLLDSLSGKSASSEATSIVAATVAKDSFLVVGAAEGLSQVASQYAKSCMMKNIVSGTLSVKETNSDLVTKASLKTKTAEAATQIKMFLDGLRGMAMLNKGANQNLDTLIEGVVIEQDDTAINIDINYPVETILSIIDKVSAKHSKKRAL